MHTATHSVAVLLELTELAKPVERPCLCCNTLPHADHSESQSLRDAAARAYTQSGLQEARSEDEPRFGHRRSLGSSGGGSGPLVSSQSGT